MCRWHRSCENAGYRRMDRAQRNGVPLGPHFHERVISLKIMSQRDRIFSIVPNIGLAGVEVIICLRWRQISTFAPMAGKCRTSNFCSSGAEVSGEHRPRWGRSENCSPVGNNSLGALHDGAKHAFVGKMRPQWRHNNYVPAAQNYYHRTQSHESLI